MEVIQFPQEPQRQPEKGTAGVACHLSGCAATVSALAAAGFTETSIG